MALGPNLAEQEALAETYSRRRAALSRREWAAAALLGAGFLTATSALWLLAPPHGIRVLPVAVCLGVLLLAMLVRIDTPLGFTVPTQLAFVPLVFVAPAAVIPICVLIAVLAARIVDVLQGKAPADRLLQCPANAWFALGPAWVFGLAGTSPIAASAGLLLAALGAQFVVDFAASALRFGIERGAGVREQVGDAWVYLVDASFSVLGLVLAERVDRAPLDVLSLVPVLGVLAVLARERHQRLANLLELNSAYRGTALVLGDVVQADDGYTGWHCRGVVALSLAVGERLGLSPERHRNLEFGALLHDVGKIAIPKEIINKPGKLDPEEWTIIKTHTLEGHRMLDRVGGFMREVGLIVRSHHESWNGSGYPDGLAGEAIPLEARIIACCDAWHAMRSDRPYRGRLPRNVALRELRVNAGTQFDPAIVDALLTVLAAEPETETETETQPDTEMAAPGKLTGAAPPHGVPEASRLAGVG